MMTIKGEIAVHSIVLCFCIAVQAAPTGSTADSIRSAKPGSIEVPLNKASEKKKTPTSPFDGILATLNDDTEFLRIDGRDRLLWKDIKNRAQIMSANQPFQFGANAMESEGMKRALLARQVSRVLRDYLGVAAIAVAAEEKGLSATEDEFRAARTNDIAQLQRRGGAAAKDIIAEIEAGNSFYEQGMTNGVLANIYLEKVMLPEIPVSKEEIALTCRKRHFYNETYEATNRLYRTQLKKVRADILAKRTTYEDASLEYSEDPDGVWGTFEVGELPDVIEKAVARLQLGDLSDVIETSNAVQIVKLLKKNFAADENGNINQKKIESYELSHIYIEKLSALPELSEAEAREIVLGIKARRELKKRKVELLSALMPRIKCVIPLVQNDKRKIKTKKPTQQEIIDKARKAIQDVENGDTPASKHEKGKPTGNGNGILMALAIAVFAAVVLCGIVIVRKSSKPKGDKQ